MKLIILVCCVSCNNSCSTDSAYENIPSYELGEENLTDDLSIHPASTSLAFGTQVPGASQHEQLQFATGNSLFNQSWVQAPASTTGLDGLGPTFNSRACANCHLKDGRGKPFEPSNFGSKGFLIRLSIAGVNSHGGPVPVPNYGNQLQNHSNLNIPIEADIQETFEYQQGTYPDGTTYELRKPNYTFINENFGSLAGVLISPRIGQQTIGLGFIDALPESEILKNVDEFDANNDGISGRANYTWNVQTQTTEIGKFGWKANEPSLKQQIAGAFFGDMGLTTSIFNDNTCPPGQEDCYSAPNGGAPEVTDIQLDRVLFYQSALAVPKRRNYKKETVLRGRELFNTVNCKACHAIDFKTGPYEINPMLSNKNIRPYSDFLLHDMGEGLADNRPDFKANGREWRTQPLWGIGLIESVNNHTFLLHDGRARNIEEAILWHGGEAENSKHKFMNLTLQERDDLISFIKSL
ncbi:MAG: c-type cytochrome [Flavobacteriaceae bacterium]|nr:c-type cytochrome [Flavobacteriaceae bacterium]